MGTVTEAWMIALRPFTAEDVPVLLGWITSPEFLVQWGGSGFSWPLDAEQLERTLLPPAEAEPTMLAFTAVEKESGEAVGHIELLAINRGNRSAIVGRVLIGPETLRGQGLGTEMVRAVLRIGFEELGLHRLGLHVFDFNASAIACYEKVGFRKEGRLRDAYRIGDSFWSVYAMSMLEEEWKGMSP